MTLIRSFLLTLFLLVHAFLGAQVDLNQVHSFAERVATANDLSSEEVLSLLEKASFQQEIINKMNRPAEGTMTWERYRNIFIQPERITAGVAFWEEHAEALAKVSADTGVAEEIILGIIGVETYFGKNKGSYQVLDALYTLSFGYPRRAKFFSSELEKFLVMSHQEKLDAATIKGSYAGAMGYGQFMPSSYLAYAKSYEPGGNADLMNSPEDAIASVANYLKVHRWQTGQPVATKATFTRKVTGLRKQQLRPKNQLSDYIRLGIQPETPQDEALAATLVTLSSDDREAHWFGFSNFYVITRYNHSPMYAMAVYLLAEEIKAQRKK